MGSGLDISKLVNKLEWRVKVIRPMTEGRMFISTSMALIINQLSWADPNFSTRNFSGTNSSASA
jgi:hypothetical protein